MSPSPHAPRGPFTTGIIPHRQVVSFTDVSRLRHLTARTRKIEWIQGSHQRTLGHMARGRILMLGLVTHLGEVFRCINMHQAGYSDTTRRELICENLMKIISDTKSTLIIIGGDGCTISRFMHPRHKKKGSDSAPTAYASPPSAPSPSPSSLTHVHRCIGYRNPHWQSLTKSARLTYPSLYDSRDDASETTSSPSPPSSLTHVHKCIGYRNPHCQSLSKSARLTYQMCVFYFHSNLVWTNLVGHTT
jgi:hypothetical protein